MTLDYSFFNAAMGLKRALVIWDKIIIDRSKEEQIKRKTKM